MKPMEIISIGFMNVDYALIHPITERAMKFLYMSDLHIDSATWNWAEFDAFLRNLDCDISAAVIAGDISNDVMANSKFLVDMRARFPRLIWVAGNHDFYNSGFHDTRVFDSKNTNNLQIPRGVREIYQHYETWSQQHQIDFLNQSACEVDGITFIGATGWHDFVAGEPYTFSQQAEAWAHAMSDSSQIQWIVDRINFEKQEMVPHILDQARRDVQGIVREQQQSPGPCVIVTHHIPRRELVMTRLHNPIWTMLNGSFVNTQLSDVNLDNVAYWLYGHTHQRGSRQYQDTLFVNNARGYPGENTTWTPIVLDI